MNRSKIHECVNVGIRYEAVQLHFWEYKNRIFGTVCAINNVKPVLNLPASYVITDWQSIFSSNGFWILRNAGHLTVF